MTCVAGALDWSKRSFQDKPNPMYMDTYANILYKMGKKDEAIAWEQKASDLGRCQQQSAISKDDREDEEGGEDVELMSNTMKCIAVLCPLQPLEPDHPGPDRYQLHRPRNVPR